LDRLLLRRFVQILNTVLGAIDTSQMEYNTLSFCYDSCWQLVIDSQALVEEYSEKSVRAGLKKAINSKRALIGMVIEGILQPREYSNKIIASTLID